MVAFTLIYRVCCLVFIILLLSGCGAERTVPENQPLPNMIVHIDAENRIYVDGEHHHISRIQLLTEELREQYPEGVQFKIVADPNSSIRIVNEVCRYIHPHPLQFASAAEAPASP